MISIQIWYVLLLKIGIQAGEGAVGVVVIEGSKRLLVALDGTTLFFGSNLGIGNAVVTTDSQKAFGDYNGQSNTSNITFTERLKNFL